ncbi:hypothetical protein FCULG_00000708 [Fusarium culmorum]|uniref:Uncharacterized protein n=1 Tax=Fusarium culmorum TaxID=5516 RepID=A0A2T4GIY4_FUSCU|nr:hypothetical protein FCULG_00000708 [Fusarium culmorum]
MSPLVSRVVRSTVAFQPLPRLSEASAPRASSAIPNLTNRSHHSRVLLGAGAVLIGATFFWFYRGGKPAAFDASGESTGIKSATK